MKQAHIFYSGIVQGVGFRYTAQRVAAHFHCTGWVRNLSDGRVEMMVQGSQGQIEDLCKELDNQFEGRIKDKVVNYSPPGGMFKTFEIRY